MKADAYAQAREDVVQQTIAKLDEDVAQEILDDALSDGEYGYCGDCDRECCDDCDVVWEYKSEGYREGYRDALEGRNNNDTGEAYSDEVIALNLKREEEARKAKETPKQDC